jgi:hypothetical protein
MPAQSESTIASHKGTTIPPIEETTTQEGILASRDNDTVTHDESTAPIEESVLMLIADTSGIEQALTRRGSPAGHALSKHETIREYMERSAEEQSYNTASAIAGPSAGPTIYSTPYSEVPLDKGKQRATSTSCGSDENSLSRKEVPPHMVYFDKDRELFERTVQYWSDHARESKVEALWQRQDLSEIDPKISGLDDLQSRIVESYARTDEFEDAMESIQHMFR